MHRDLEETIKVLKKGGVVIFPTDTAFGVGCRMDDENAVRRIFEIKRKPLSDALLVLVDSVDMAEKYVDIPGDVRKKLINRYWPGGLTIFFKCKKDKVPSIVRSGSDVLAIRWPNHKEIEEIIKKVGVPIIATSANISGKQTPFKVEDVNKSLIDNADYVMEGECAYKKESTIIDTTVTPWKIVRKGAVKLELWSSNHES
jgi:L-threonylcarbamoyladenylate synthase